MLPGDYAELYVFDFEKDRLRCDKLDGRIDKEYLFITKFYVENCKAK